MTACITEVLLDGLCFPESLRWHEDRLWFSDFFDRGVFSVDSNGVARGEAAVVGQPSGLGWDPDGRLLVVSKLDRMILRREADGSLMEHANLSGLGEGDCNDMVVDAHGRAYVGEVGFDPFAWFGAGGTFAEAPAASLFRVEPDGSTHVAAAGLRVPNGTVLLDGGRVLVVAESFGAQLTAFDVDPATGVLTHRRVWAPLPGRTPDGICADRSGGLWVADARRPECVRVEEGGVISDTVSTSQNCYACALGGSDGRTLYCATAPATDEPSASHARSGRIEQLISTPPAPTA